MKVLIVVDMQNDFITGSLGSGAAKAIVPLVAKRVADAAENGEMVFFTLDAHDEGYMATQEGRNLPVAHCKQSSWGYELDDEILAEAGDYARIVKRDSFGSRELIGELEKLADSPKGNGLEVEICGLCAEICVSVVALMIKGMLPEAAISLDRRLTAGLDEAGYEAALTVLRACQVRIL